MKTLMLADPLVPLERLIPVWAALRKAAPADAAQALRHAWGVLAQRLSEEELAVWKRAFDAAAVPTVAIEDGPTLALPAPQKIQRLPENIPPLELLAACAFREEQTVTRAAAPQGPTAAQRIASAGILLATGIPVRLGPKKEKTPVAERRSEDHLIIDCVGGTPAARWRINAKEFDYSCLGAQKTYSALANARLLLKDLAAKRPQAWRNEGARRLLEGRAEAMPYRSLEDLEREESWLVAVQRERARTGR